MNQLTVEGFDDALADSIRRIAEQEGLSLNQTAAMLLRKGAGLQEEAAGNDTAGSSLDHSTGTRGPAEADETDEALEELEASMAQPGSEAPDGEKAITMTEPASKEKLAEYCRKNGITWLATYDLEIVRRILPDVELKLLADFEDDRRIGYFALFRIRDELASMFGGVNADLRTLDELNEYYRDEILVGAEVLFAA